MPVGLLKEGVCLVLLIPGQRSYGKTCGMRLQRGDCSYMLYLLLLLNSLLSNRTLQHIARRIYA